jgi:hypothetical protein
MLFSAEAGAVAEAIGWGPGRCAGAAGGDAAPEWQEGSLGWRSRGLEVACPFEGLVSRRIKCDRSSQLTRPQRIQFQLCR